MELSEIIKYTFMGTAFLTGVNWAEYGKTKKWLKEHGNADYSWHEEKIDKKSLISKIDFYISYPGRKLAYLEHFQNKRF